MFKTGLTLGDVDVFVVDFRTIPNLDVRDEYEKTIVQTPAMATMITEEFKSAILGSAEVAGCDVLKESAAQLRTDRPTVMFTKVFLEELGDEGALAIYEHELTHIRNDDLTRVELGILDDVEAELLADAGGAAATSKKAMHDALVTAIKLICRVSAKFFDMSYDQAFEMHMADFSTQRRLAALS